MKKEIQSFTDLRFRLILKALLAFKKSGREDDLHQIRVEIKKLRAVLRFLNASDKEFKYKKTYGPVRDIFKSGATLRSIHVLDRLSKKYKIEKLQTVKNKSFLLRNIKSSIPHFIRELNEQKKPVAKSIKRLKDNSLQKYLAKKIKQLKNSTQGAIPQNEFHTIRKLMKDLQYLFPLHKEKNKYQDFLESTSSLIGDWHDLVILSAGIKNVRTTSQPKQLSSDKISLTRKIRISISDFYAKKPAGVKQ